MHKMRTTIDIPEELIEEAKKISGSPTKTKTIIRALEEMIRLHKLSEITQFRGAIDLDIDLDILRDRK